MKFLCSVISEVDLQTCADIRARSAVTCFCVWSIYETEVLHVRNKTRHQAAAEQSLSVFNLTALICAFLKGRKGVCVCVCACVCVCVCVINENREWRIFIQSN